MAEWFNYLLESKIYINYLMEFVAALAGSIYLLRSNSNQKDLKFFVKFLWSVLIIDLIGNYAGLAYFSNYEILPFIEGSPIARNFWYYNIMEVYFICFYTNLFRRQLANTKMKRILKWLIFFYIFFAVSNMILSGEFFEGDLIINDMMGAFMIILSIFAYFFEMMMSDKVLYFYKSLFFYMAIGISISYLTIIPINIYDAFITIQNTEFLEVFYAVIRYANIFMYSMFALGFFMEYRSRQSLILQRS